MYGAFSGDIVGSKYEFNNIKTKNFPLFSKGCDYTDDTIMTVAVAKAIMASHQERYEKGDDKGKSFQELLVEIMQDFGKRYPHPTGAYGGSFAKWLRQKTPKPYGSYGNGSAMRVSPCGLAAVTIEEALALARASACVTHDHPEGIKGAEAVSAAVFLAKVGKTKSEIGGYIKKYYYPLQFTLDSIRETYQFDGSCQGSVPQAIVAFLESENFEDAIRNVISIGGDCDTTGAITGSIAWVYYAVQTKGYVGWVNDTLDPYMQEIKTQATAYLPKEFIKIADEFHEMCWRRAGTYYRPGNYTPVLKKDEYKKYGKGWGFPTDPAAVDVAKTPLNCKQYGLDYVVKESENRLGERVPGACEISHDKFLHQWRIMIQLDEERLWFLSVFIQEDGSFVNYSLDEEAASDSHYHFKDEQSIRSKLYVSGDRDRYFHEILIRYLKEHGGAALWKLIMPYVTAQFHCN